MPKGWPDGQPMPRGRVRKWFGGQFAELKAVAGNAMHFTTLGGGSWGGGSGWWWTSGQQQLPDYAAIIGDGSGTSVVEPVIRWIARNTPAPVRVRRRLDPGEYQDIAEHPMLALIDEPNPYYDGRQLMKATAADLSLNGNAYWWAIPSAAGRPAQLWWIPHLLIEPRWPSADDTVYISHYDYKPGDGRTYEIPPEQIIHFRDGIDPANTRKGQSPLRAIMREIFTDEEAARYSAAILTNMGVPGTIIAPTGDRTVSKEAAEKAKTRFDESTKGSRRGSTIVFGQAVSILEFGFSPEQLNLRNMRRLPEERISAQFGVPAIVAGLGAGLDRSCVPADARVQTPYGTKTIAELEAGAVVWSFKDGEIVPRKVEHKWPARRDMVYEVRTQNRILRATGNHPLMVRVPGNSAGANADRHAAYEWRHIDDIRPGDRIIFAKSYPDQGGAVLPDGSEANQQRDRTNDMYAREAGLSDDLGFTTVESIQPLEDMDVYDLTVEDGHSFFCENVLVSNTFANYAEAREAGYEECIIPLQDTLAAVLRRQLLVFYEDDMRGIEVYFDRSDVRILQEDATALSARLIEQYAGGVIMLSEARRGLGHEADDSLDVFAVPVGRIITPRDQLVVDITDIQAPEPTPEQLGT